MKNLILILIILIPPASQVFGQRYITKNGHIKFYSETPIETIEAHNKQVSSLFDANTGDFVFRVLMKSFEFEKALMQEHFNENYVESDKFPNAVFQGKVINLPDIDLSKSGTYQAIVEGELVIHGVSKKIKETGSFEVQGNRITGKSVFIVKPADYDIKIPTTVINNIAKEIEVTVNVNLEPLN